MGLWPLQILTACEIVYLPLFKEPVKLLPITARSFLFEWASWYKMFLPYVLLVLWYVSTLYIICKTCKYGYKYEIHVLYIIFMSFVGLFDSEWSQLIFYKQLLATIHCHLSWCCNSLLKVTLRCELLLKFPSQGDLEMWVGAVIPSSRWPWDVSCCCNSLLKVTLRCQLLL